MRRLDLGRMGGGPTPTLRGYHDFAAVAKSQMPSDARPMIAQTMSPTQQISFTFPYQSYFDDTLLEAAILSQNTNSPIVNTGITRMLKEQIPGYAVGLHPSSETPIGLKFLVGGQASSAQTIILSPGQIVRPHGLPRGQDDGSFSGFEWGIPFGWLGGGLATVLVFQTPDADVSWPGNKEIIFHRQRMAIQDASSLPPNAPKNWPLRFPWVQALSGATAANQNGQPAIALEPTRTFMRLRVGTLAAPADMRVIYQETQDFDLDLANAVIATPVSAFDITWGTWASVGAGNLGTQYQVQSIQDLGWRLGADRGGVVLASTDPALAGQYVDVVRYGRL